MNLDCQEPLCSRFVVGFACLLASACIQSEVLVCDCSVFVCEARETCGMEVGSQRRVGFCGFVMVLGG